MKKAKIYIGQMRERITLQSRVETANALNEIEVTYVDEACVSAKVVDTKTGSSEIFQADHQVAIGRKEITIRYRQGIDETWRVVYRQIPYDILAIQEPVIHAYQTLICEKRGNAVAT
jgi:SPP1 family predicted phage head-tail adaptor